MASVTQTIPTYTGGISQQPDQLKNPGQVNVATNVMPDITDGLAKRPGSRFITELSTANPTCRWFSYYRDEAEQYIGQIKLSDGTIRMWKCSDGSEKTVVYETNAVKTYLATTGTHGIRESDIQTLTLNDNTYLVNRNKTVALTDTNRTGVRPHEAYINLKKVAYSSQYALNLFDDTTLQTVHTATRISVQREVDSRTNCASNGTFPSAGTLPTQGNVCNVGGTDFEHDDDVCPNVDTRIFDISYTTTDYASGTWQHTAANKTGWNVSDGWSSSGGSNTDRKNLVFRITTTGQSMLQGNDPDPEASCRYTTTHDLLFGGQGWRTGDSFKVWMNNARYKITVEKHSVSKQQANLGLIRPDPTSFDSKTVVTAESILGDIRTSIIDADPDSDDWVDWDESNQYGIKQIGNGLYIKRKDQTTNARFSITSPVGELLGVLGENVDTIEDLPQQCRHGYVVKVTNSEAQEDDYYMKFIGDGDTDGTGVWEECAAPDRQVQFDYGTMPVNLIRTADGNFRACQLDGHSYTISGTTYTVDEWEDCEVGDTTTSPNPSFVGKTISKMVFFRNRLVMLSDENVVMSRPGNFFHFWNKTAMTFSNSDPIDLSCTDDKPAVVYDALQVSAGLILFTPTSQFLLTTDSDVLSPTTAKINILSSYHYNTNTTPISLGTTVGFLDNAGKNTRFFEMTRVVREGEPEVVDQTKVVSTLFSKDIELISNSRDNGVVFFSEFNKSTLYVYKYFTIAEKRIQASWFQWELTGNLLHHTVMDDAFYAVVVNGTKVTLQKFDLQLSDDTKEIVDDLDTASDTTDDITYRVHLDNAVSVSIASNAYNDTTKKTTFAIPTGFNNTSKQAAIYDNTEGSGATDPIGMFAKATVNGSNYEVPGDFSGNTVLLGYLIDMEVEFPTIYYTQQAGEKTRSDIQGSLILHRAKLNFGDAGMFDTVLKRRGKPTYTETWEAPDADWYRANQVDVVPSVIQTIPIYERNTNVTLTIKSSHPSPLTLHSMAWEGDYNNKFYRRV